MALSERLRKLRKEQGLSQEAVARRADIGLRAYGELERGIAKDPHLTTLEGIASALGTTVAELVGEESEVSAAGKASAPPETGPSARSRSRSGSSAKGHLTIPEEALSELEADELRYIEDLLKEGRVWIPLAELVRESVRRR